MKNRIAALALAAALLGGTGIAAAGRPAGSVPAHSHHLMLENGEKVQVGPDACSNGTSVQFDHFHNDVHRGAKGITSGGTVIMSGGGCP